MNIHLLQWGLVSFITGVLLSLPIAAIYYDNSPPWAKLLLGTYIRSDDSHRTRFGRERLLLLSDK